MVFLKHACAWVCTTICGGMTGVHISACSYRRRAGGRICRVCWSHMEGVWDLAAALGSEASCPSSSRMNFASCMRPAPCG